MPEKFREVKKPPVIVVRSGKLVPEVVRTEKENLETHVEGSMEPVLIDVNSQKTRMIWMRESRKMGCYTNVKQ